MRDGVTDGRPLLLPARFGVGVGAGVVMLFVRRRGDVGGRLLVVRGGGAGRPMALFVMGRVEGPGSRLDWRSSSARNNASMSRELRRGWIFAATVVGWGRGVDGGVEKSTKLESGGMSEGATMDWNT